MNWIAYRDVPPKKIKAPGDIKERQRRADVIELAESFEATGGGPGNALWVDADMNLIAGRDRLAAALLAKVSKVPVRIGVFTLAEAVRAKAYENLRRRNIDRAAELATMERELEAVLTVESAQGGTDVPPNAAWQTVRSEARKQVAAVAGVTPAAVRKAEQRARAKDDGSGAAKAAVDVGGDRAVTSGAEQASAPPPIRTFGVPLAAATLVLATKQQAAVDALDGILRRAQAACGDVASAGLGALAERMRAELHRLASEVRQDRPAALCPVGKGSCSRACQRCHGTHLVPERQLADLPAELLDDVAPKVPDGRGGFQLAIGAAASDPGADAKGRNDPREAEGPRRGPANGTGRVAPGASLANPPHEPEEHRYRVVCDACGADLSGGPCGCPAALAAEAAARGAAGDEDEELPL